MEVEMGARGLLEASRLTGFLSDDLRCDLCSGNQALYIWMEIISRKTVRLSQLAREKFGARTLVYTCKQTVLPLTLVANELQQCSQLACEVTEDVDVGPW